MSPIRRMSMGRGGPEHDVVDAAMDGFTGQRFTGKVAVVTGAASGVGRAVAHRLAAEGASVAALDIAADRLDEAVAEVNGSVAARPGAGTVTGYHCDVTSETMVTGAVDRLVGELGPPQVVCNVAGVGGFFNTADMPLADWDRILSTNLTGPFLVCRATLPHLLAGGGSIVNVASNTALMGQNYSAAYCASKAGLLMFSKALAAEFLTRVRVNVVAPGGVDTPLVGSFVLPDGADVEVLGKLMTPMGFATPSEIAAAIAFLASDEAAYATGSVLSVDGGLTI